MKMEWFGAQAWPCWLRLCKKWEGRFGSDALLIDQAGLTTEWPILDTTLTAQRGWFWSRITLQRTPESFELGGLAHKNAQYVAQAFERQRTEALARLEQSLESDHRLLEPLLRTLHSQINEPRYLAARDRARIEQILRPHAARIAAALARARSPHAEGFAITSALLQIAQPLTQLAQHHAAILSERNRRFVHEELQRWRVFFNHCEETPLTDEQAIAAITFEENTLLVAAAGSGKTSTVVGKVAYALAKGIAGPQDILCLAFNGKAAREIGLRITARLQALTRPQCPIDDDVKRALSDVCDSGIAIEARTFHSLGRAIVNRVEQRNVPVSHEDGENTRRLVRAVERCQHDPRFATNWLLLQTVARFPQPPESRFKSEGAYQDYLRGIWRQRKRGKGRDDGILTLGCTKLVKSFEEVAISNWLYVMGVDFEYEAPFVAGAAMLCPGRLWTPDFTYRIGGPGEERVIVHEHFALNAHGKAPKFFRDPVGYAREASDKQSVLAVLDGRHFWTSSAEYADGTLFAKLEAWLRAAGVRLQPRSADAVLQRLKEIGNLPDYELIARAVSQIRQNGWDRATLESRLPEQAEPARARLFLEVAWPVADAVEDLLIEDKKLDYDEMIRRALVYRREKRDPKSFKFILADEFQDTAPGRGELVRQMLCAREDSLFFAVGDDWQAINRFAGSDLRFFNGFGGAFNVRAGADRRCDLTQTFRSNQGIADIARHFVLKNKSQLPKEVVAQDKTCEGVIDVCTYRDDSEVLEHVEATLQRWVERHTGGKKPSVFLLGRYGEKRVAGLSAQQIDDLRKRWSDRLDLDAADAKEPRPLYMTMHKSKGLQADYVLILGLFRVEHDWFCFPSEREDDPLLQMILPPREAVADADERRLFYVALTRAKRQVVLLAQESHPSPYALELLRDHRDGKVLFNGTQELPPLCPACKAGLVFSRHNPKADRPFHACSDRHGCGKTWSQWPPIAHVPTMPKLPTIGHRTVYGARGGGRLGGAKGTAKRASVRPRT